MEDLQGGREGLEIVTLSMEEVRGGRRGRGNFIGHARKRKRI